ncbi:MAG: ribonuclease H-like domain-containing protein [Bacteroidota bacterium]
MKKVNLKQEMKLWSNGITDWEKYEAAFDQQLSLFETAVPTFSSSRKNLESNNLQYFIERIPVSEYYRIALNCPEDVLFLDIETTGSGFRFDQITVVGWSLGDEFGFYIDGEDPRPMLEAIDRSMVVVTFNGSGFDIPIVKRAFPKANFPVCHIDLRYLTRRIGLRGGQKKIEKAIGMYRETDILDMTGQQAPILWNDYQRGDIKALNTLIRYNYADVYGMKIILDYAIGEILNQFENLNISRPNFAKQKGNIPERFLVDDLV